MRVALVHDAVLPTLTYGGTERVVWWLAKGLAKQGVSVTLVARPGSSFPYGDFIPYNFDVPAETAFPRADVHHYFATPGWAPNRPYVVTINGNGRAGERYLANSVFISRDHARRHHAAAVVYNGIDPEDYQFGSAKSSDLLFLAKASWRVKNVKGAIRIARSAGKKLNIVGGSRVWLPSWRGVRWCGMLGGEAKAHFLTSAKGLLFPVVWDEPFGLTVIEALMSGTPVIGSRRGSLPELIPPGIGILCNTESEFVSAISRLGEFSAKACREWAIDRFHFETMTTQYRVLYERVLAGETLNPSQPFTDTHQGLIRELGRELGGELGREH